MDGVKVVDTFDVTGPGRPVGERSREIEAALQEAMVIGKYGLKFDLLDDEKGEYFYRFTQRARAAAERAGVRVNVAMSKSDGDVGNVRILED